MNITLIGAGMGAAATLTMEAREALAQADAIIGAERLLSGLPEEVKAERIPLALPEKIALAIDEARNWENVCVVLSGDIGFYSGARRLLELLRPNNPVLIPGISTPQYFTALLRRPWQDIRLTSAHGVHCDILAEVLNHPSVLFLTGGETTPKSIARTLCEAGLDQAAITVGENLSSADERIIEGLARELADAPDFSPLCAVLVDNDQTFTREAGGVGIADGDFLRGDVPMTKREVRVQALSLLELRPHDVVYDIGAGTGSLAVEMALQARWGRVYAVERDESALRLLEDNRKKFGAYNMILVPGTAPEALWSLPAPDAVFIGGSKGYVGEIMQAALAKNPRVRLVAAAITLETLSMAMDCFQGLAVEDIEVVQIAASRAVAKGRYHMLEAQNPVFLASGGGR